MATNIPPHNLTEIVNACLALLDDPALPLAALMQHVPGPRFSDRRHHQRRAGDRDGLPHRPRPAVGARPGEHSRKSARATGRRSVVTELPYQVNKARLIERIAQLVREKLIEGIAGDGLRDESDKDGMRIVIELKRGEVSRDRPQQPLCADADGDGVRHQHGGAAGRAAEADVAEGHARCLHPPPARGGHAPHDLRSRQGP